MDRIKISQSVIERIYEIQVKQIMKTDVPTIEPDTRMSDIYPAVRDNSFACVPVVENGKLAGQIPIDRYIKWLSSGEEDTVVRDVMEAPERILNPEEPVISAVREMEEVGFRGIPVVDHSDDRYLGILCRCRMMEGLLSVLNMDSGINEKAEPAKCMIGRINADSAILNMRYEVKSGSLEYGGEISSTIRKDLYSLRIPGEIVRRAAIAAYEAEMNLLSYTEGGVFSVSVTKDELKIRVDDNGPGIPDVELAMQPGYSTAPEWIRELGFGAGMGLFNIKNCSDSFELTSEVGTGTCLKVGINMGERCA